MPIVGALFRKGPGDVVSINDQLAFMTQVADQRTAEASLFGAFLC
jgi:hypothetical protein